jgi:branched-chain amino acid transport system ATP-binding protein/neutral amino acid transport system ATP-binding protein
VGLLSATGLVAGYAPGEEILKGVELRVEPGEVISIIGPNGAGKSTLLKAIAGLLKASRGEIRFRDRRIETLHAREICALGLAFVPQEMNIFPTMSVTENLEIGGFLEPKKAKGRIAAILERFPMLREKRRDAARTLSGGQRQILAMAMALMVEPAVLLLDEPSAGLSPIAAENLFEIIRGINAEGVAIVMVEQNALEALSIASRGYIMVDGQNHTEGAAADLAGDPNVRKIFLGG